MATFADLKLHHRPFIKRYPFWRYEIKDNPTAELKKPLSECRVALITTAAMRLESDKRFSNMLKLGDHSFRQIPNDAEVQSLFVDHDSNTFDHSGIEADKNLAFPLDRFRELESDGKIGRLNHRHISFMGSIISSSKLIGESAPAAARILIEDKVEAVFLAPV